LRLKSLVPRRPSAPMVVSFIALFVSLGGAGYAAVSLPRNSVGNAQLQNGSVGNWKLKSNAVGAKKIINGSVGAKQVNSSQVQLRVSSSCSTGAISSVGLSGSVTCTPTIGNEYGSNTAATTLGASATQVATQSLAAGSSYLVMAYPHAVITAGASPQHVEVDCTLSVPAGSGTPPPANPTTATKTLAVDVTSMANPAAGTIPLVLPVASSTSVQPATVSCTDTAASPATPAPTVKVDTTISAIQTASNN
jgi:hypothetical protein